VREKPDFVALDEGTGDAASSVAAENKR
jgi:hypothetical protein